MFSKGRTLRLWFGVLLIALLFVGEIFPASGQGAAGITVNVTPSKGNPILTRGKTGTWDFYGVGAASVFYSDGLFHMLFIGYTETFLPDFVVAVGYATSKDGLNWTKYEKNPVFVPDPSLAPHGVFTPEFMLDGKTWVMYFSPYGEYSKNIHLPTPSDSVLRATAPSPTGPWTVDPEPVLKAGTKMTDWDSGWLVLGSILRTDQGYALYYDASSTMGDDKLSYNAKGIGRATSPDGIHWTKYNDPITTDPAFGESDPVFRNSIGASVTVWDSAMVDSPVVRLSPDGWEMFYAGNNAYNFRMGFATSKDGITWTRYGDPVLDVIGAGVAPTSVLVTGDTYYLYYGSTEDGPWPAGMSIRVATVTIKHQE